LKLADFGMATLFEYGGRRKMAVTLCGSPPYVAPEILSCSSKGSTKGGGYAADVADIWSCGIVLFVLLAGNTPWSKPIEELDEYGRPSEFSEYLQTNGRPEDELWQNLPTEVLSLLRGMMRVDVKTRFSLEDVRRHPWYTRSNRYINKDGRLVDPVSMATNMFESLHVSFDSDPFASQRNGRRIDNDCMEVDDRNTLKIPLANDISSTQPVTPAEDMLFDWERPSYRRMNGPISATQPAAAPQHSTFDIPIRSNMNRQTHTQSSQAAWLEDEPTLSQFTRNPQVPLSRTQLARKFHDILPSTPLTKFYSVYTLNLLVPLLLESLTRLAVPVPSSLASRKFSAQDVECVVKVKTVDSRGCQLSGSIIFETTGDGLVEVEFAKASGDPLEWRRLFKKVVVLCRDAVYRPEE
jgi:serine/threonine-protein kinase Chk1